MNSNTGNRDFKAALFQVASLVGFLSHFSQNIPSMFTKKQRLKESSIGMCPKFIFSFFFIYLLVIIILKDSGTVCEGDTKENSFRVDKLP